MSGVIGQTRFTKAVIYREFVKNRNVRERLTDESIPRFVDEIDKIQVYAFISSNMLPYIIPRIMCMCVTAMRYALFWFYFKTNVHTSNQIICNIKILHYLCIKVRMEYPVVWVTRIPTLAVFLPSEIELSIVNLSIEVNKPVWTIDDLKSELKINDRKRLRKMRSPITN